jgi:hypothetical protein
MAEATASWFIPLPKGVRGRILDPCSGEGEIAATLDRLLKKGHLLMLMASGIDWRKRSLRLCERQSCSPGTPAPDR